MKWFFKHKVWSVIIAIAFIWGGYSAYKTIKGTPTTTKYVTVAAAKTTVISSITGSGQVSSLNQVDIKSKVSGTIISLPMIAGTSISSGALLAQLDMTDAQKAVSDAELNLQDTQINFEKNNGQIGATTSKAAQNAQDNLKKDYDDAFTTVSNAFLDMPSIVSGLQSMLYGHDFTAIQTNLDFYKATMENYDALATDAGASQTDSAYASAKVSYDKTYADYKIITRTSDSAVLEDLVSETYSTVQQLSDALKDANNFIQLYKDLLIAKNLRTSPIADTELSTLNTYTGKINTQLSNLLNIKNTIKNDKDAIINASYDLQSAENSLTKSQNALQNAKDALADYTIHAPFSGIIAKVNIKNRDDISSGTVLGTIITTQKIAQISLNEVDVAKIKIGQKVTLTFDALPDITISGQVAEIDSLGAVTQGVVTYGVQIGFDTQDVRIKPGMSVGASIITDAKLNVIAVPNSAIKTQGSIQYVQIIVNGAPQNKNIETGISNDTETEITNGINEGDMVITQTITSTAATTQTPSAGGLRIPGFGGAGGGGAVRGTTGR